LRNPFYVGQVRYKSEILGGEQLPIIERGTFDAVQAKLDQQRSNHITTRAASDALLMGRIFDDAGNLMTPTHTKKNGARYRYYASSTFFQGEKAKSGSTSRVSAEEVERLVIEAIRKRIAVSQANGNTGDNASVRVENLSEDRELIRAYVQRVEVTGEALRVGITRTQTLPERQRRRSNDHSGRDSPKKRAQPTVLQISWKKRQRKMPREIIPAAPDAQNPDRRPVRSETRGKLIGAIAQSRRWLDELVSSKVTSIEEIARREQCSIRQVNMIISLAFLSPAIVNAAIERRLPRGVGVARLRHAPVLWSLQPKMLGLLL
jgi:hypothetical protein